jgi:hypothetical protein
MGRCAVQLFSRGLFVKQMLQDSGHRGLPLSSTTSTNLEDSQCMRSGSPDPRRAHASNRYTYMTSRHDAAVQSCKQIYDKTISKVRRSMRSKAGNVAIYPDDGGSTSFRNIHVCRPQRFSTWGTRRHLTGYVKFKNIYIYIIS